MKTMDTTEKIGLKRDMRSYYDEGLRIGVGTLSENDQDYKAKFQEAMTNMYTICKLPSGPKQFVWFASPEAFRKGTEKAKKKTGGGDSKEWTSSVIEVISGAVDSLIQYTLEKKDAVTEPILNMFNWSRNDTSVEVMYRLMVEAASDSDDGRSRSNLRDFGISSAKAAARISGLRYIRDCMDMKLPTKAIKFIEAFDFVSRHCFSFLSLPDVCYVCEKPVRLSMDSQRRFHDESEAAAEFSDGWKLYAIDGVRVPIQVVLFPDQINAKMVDKERNAETRRIMIRRHPGSWEGYLKECGAKKVHSDDWGTLYEKKYEDGFITGLVQVICPSTGREYVMPVNLTKIERAYGKKTARGAVASTFRVRGERNKLMFEKPEEYNPTVQT